MANIGDTSTINKVRFSEQASDPTTPASNYWILYFKSGGLYIRDDAGVVTQLATSSGAAPSDASYVTLAANASLSAEAVLGSTVIMAGTLAARPAAGTAGKLYLATDTSGGTLYRDNGATWDQAASPVTLGTMAAQNANAVAITGGSISGQSAVSTTGGTTIGSNVTLTGGAVAVLFDGAESQFRRDSSSTAAPTGSITQVSIQNRDITDGNGVGLRFVGADSGATVRNTAFIWNKIDTHHPTATTSKLVFYTSNNSATPGIRMTVGNAGAGIDVIGASTFSSTVAITGALSLTVPLSVANGGTGAADAANARSNLGVASGAISFTFGDGTNAIVAASEPDQYIRLPFGITITKVSVLADASGSIVLDLWSDTYANYPPTVADTITASAKPTLSSAIKSEDSTLTGWTTSIAAGSILTAHVDSAATVKRAVLTVEYVRA